MDFDEEDNSSILLLLVASGIKKCFKYSTKISTAVNVVKPWLQRRSKSVCHTIISELELNDHYDHQKYFRVSSETHFFKFRAFSLI